MEHETAKTTCNMPLELLSAYLDNELSGKEREEVAEHLNTCSHCRRWIEECKKIEETIRAVEIEEPSLDYVYQLKKKVLSKVYKKQVVLWRYLSILVPAAAVVLIVVLNSQQPAEPVVGMESRIGYVEVEEKEGVSPMPLSKASRLAKSISTPVVPKASEELTQKTPEWSSEVTPKEVGMMPGKEIIRAMVDSAGRVVSVARGKSLSPEEDTTLVRLLKGKKIAPPRLGGRPSQVFIEIAPEPRDSN